MCIYNVMQSGSFIILMILFIALSISIKKVIIVNMQVFIEYLNK